MAMFTDTVTIYTKVSEDEWKSTVVRGVQWSDVTEKMVSDKTIIIKNTTQITFPKGTFEGVLLESSREEDVIVKGVCKDRITSQRGNRIADFMREHPKSGTIRSVNDNSGRDFLPNIKVVISQ